MPANISLVNLASNLQVAPKQVARGKVVSLRGPLIVARLPEVAIGDMCFISRKNRPPLIAQTVSFEEDLCFLAPFDDLDGISPNAEVTNNSMFANIQVGEDLIGKIVDPLGLAYGQTDNSFRNNRLSSVPLKNSAPNALQRKSISCKMETGIKSIDLFLPLGYGQRVGLFAGPGVGKSTLLGMIAKNAAVDLTVIALVGERGREVNEFIYDTLGEEGLKKAIVVVSTSDESPLRRVMAAESATAIAEYFRARGKNVLLLVDSLTRVARAIRDVSLSIGELPLRQGYTPSVYSQLPRLLERSGNSEKGSITAIYTILTQNDESNDALGEEVKSILDGHFVLNSDLANEGIRPAIDILASISRLQERLQNQDEKTFSKIVRAVYQRIRKDKDIVLLGGAADKHLQAALKLEHKINALLTQQPGDNVSYKEAMLAVREIAEEYQKYIC